MLPTLALAPRRGRALLGAHRLVLMPMGMPFAMFGRIVAFRHKGDATKHERTHTGATPFGCLTCGKKFSRKYSVTVHERAWLGHAHLFCGGPVSLPPR